MSLADFGLTCKSVRSAKVSFCPNPPWKENKRHMMIRKYFFNFFNFKNINLICWISMCKCLVWWTDRWLLSPILWILFPSEGCISFRISYRAFRGSYVNFMSWDAHFIYKYDNLMSWYAHFIYKYDNLMSWYAHFIYKYDNLMSWYAHFIYKYDNFKSWDTYFIYLDIFKSWDLA